MARDEGTFDFSANFEVKTKGTIDARQLVETFSDLLNFTESNFIPTGFPVSVSSTSTFNGTEYTNGIYECIDEDNVGLEASWKKTSNYPAKEKLITVSLGDIGASNFEDDIPTKIKAYAISNSITRELNTLHKWKLTENPPYFIIEVKTDNLGVSNNDQFTFDNAQGDYNVIAKQDGIIVDTFNNLSDEETITLSNGAGTYTLEVSAKTINGFTGLRFVGQSDREKLLKVKQWGVFNDTRDQLFSNCKNLTEIANDNDWLNSRTESGLSLFSNCNLNSLPSTLTLDSLTNGRSMFDGNSLTDLPSGMTLASLEDGRYMFRDNSLTALPSGMILDSLTNGSSMFQGSSLTGLPSGMTLDSLTDARIMFDGNSLTDLPSGMTLASLEDGSLMFRYNSLTDLPSEMTLNSLILSEGMFRGNSITGLPSGMTLTNLKNGSYMFRDNSLTDLPSEMILANLEIGVFMFQFNTINTTRFSQLYEDMESNNSNNNVFFGGGNSKYNTQGETAKDLLIEDHNWSFMDGGLE